VFNSNHQRAINVTANTGEVHRLLGFQCTLCVCVKAVTSTRVHLFTSQ